MRFLLTYFIAFAFILNAQTHYNYNEWQVKPEKRISERTIWRLNLIPEKKEPETNTTYIDTIRNKDGKILRIESSIDPPNNKSPEQDSVFILEEKYNEVGFPIETLGATNTYDKKNRLLACKAFNHDSTLSSWQEYIYDDTNKIVFYKEWTDSSLQLETTYKYDVKNRFIESITNSYRSEQSWRFDIVYSSDNKTAVLKFYTDSRLEDITKIKFRKGLTVSLIRYDTAMKVIHQIKKYFKGNNLISDVRINEKGIVYQKQKYFYLKNGLVDHCDEYNDKKQLKYRYQAIYKYR